MSKMWTFPRICAVCGALHEYRILTFTDAIGSPDLDLRPPQMKRGTMPVASPTVRVTSEMTVSLFSSMKSSSARMISTA